MPSIARYTQQIGVLRNLPQSVPGPEAFGAEIGQSLNRIGEQRMQEEEQARRIAEAEAKQAAEKQQDQDDRIWTMERATELQNNLHKIQQDSLQNLSGDGTGYFDSQSKAFDAAVAPILADAKARGGNALYHAQSTILEMKSRFLNQASEQEAKLKDGARQASLTRTGENIVTRANSGDAGALNDIPAYGAIYKQVYGEAAWAKEEARITGEAKLALVINLANTNPDRVLAAAAGETTGATSAAPSGDYKSFVAAHENASGDPNAKNPDSSARGVHQIVKDTWNQYAKEMGLKVYDPDDPSTHTGKGSIGDPEAQDKVFEALTADNRAALKKALGHDPDNVELYAAHFFGSGAAPKVLTADPDTPLSEILSEKAMNANPKLKGMTAGDWIGKMRGGGEAGSGAPGGGQGGIFDGLTVQQKMQAINTAEAAKNNQRVAMKPEIDRAKENGLALAGNGEDWRSAIPPKVQSAMGKDFTEFSAAADHVQGVAIRAKGFSTKPIGEIDAIVEANTPDPNKPDYAQQQADYAIFAEAADKIKKARQEDPAGYVRQAFPAVGDIMDAALSDPSVIPDLISAQDEAYTQLGIPESERHVLTNAAATTIVEAIRKAGNPKDQLGLLMNYLDTGSDAANRRIFADLSSVKGGLPPGAALIADMAPGNRTLAEKLWSALLVDTKGVTLKADANNAIDDFMSSGLFSVFSHQQTSTGNANYGAQGLDIRAAVEQIAKANGGSVEAVNQAVSDLTSHLSVIDDENLGHVYYPKAIEEKNPGAVEYGLTALRNKIDAKTVEAALLEANPGASYGDKALMAGAASYLAESAKTDAIWVNNGDGFDLILPGSNGVFLMRISVDDAVAAGRDHAANVQSGRLGPRAIGGSPPPAGSLP